jgi:diaminohydroxyphosphoribosylaminopyrimidine deaminase/5-amino-6-(5-phosphoribosylamino)uracil reductase
MSSLGSDEIDVFHMARALELAARGEGFVEPNPMVGCVVAGPSGVVSEGWHRRFGLAHAEVEALAAVGEQARGATAYVTLEPCCHFGKTPPCTQAIIAAGMGRVVGAMADPFPQVSGRGFAELKAAGIDVEVGLMEGEARRLNAPYIKRVTTGRPWVVAKWAMTLDGKLATRSRDSRWISSPESREIGHHLRGRVDAILIGRGTADADDPLLTARPPGPRTAMRIVLDSRAGLDSKSQLVRTARDVPVLVAAGSDASDSDRSRLSAAGCEVVIVDGPARDGSGELSYGERLGQLLDELGRRQMTSVLVEGGSTVLGGFFDARMIDEVHVFIAPKLSGGEKAPSPIGGQGIERMADALSLMDLQVEYVGPDIYLSGRIRK